MAVLPCFKILVSDKSVVFCFINQLTSLVFGDCHPLFNAGENTKGGAQSVGETAISHPGRKLVVRCLPLLCHNSGVQNQQQVLHIGRSY